MYITPYTKWFSTRNEHQENVYFYKGHRTKTPIRGRQKGCERDRRIGISYLPNQAIQGCPFREIQRNAESALYTLTVSKASLLL